MKMHIMKLLIKLSFKINDMKLNFKMYNTLPTNKSHWWQVVLFPTVSLMNNIQKHDPEEVNHEYGLSLTTLEDLGPVDAVVVAVGHNEFRSIELERLKTFLRVEKPLLVDVKGLFERELAKKMGLTIFRL